MAQIDLETIKHIDKDRNSIHAKVHTTCYIMQGTYRYRSYKDDYYEAKPSPFLSINGVQNYRNNLIW